MTIKERKQRRPIDISETQNNSMERAKIGQS